MTWDQVMSMLSQGDTVGTRFIKRLDTPDTLIISMVALANTLGGTIVIGLDKNNFQLTGSTLTDAVFHDLLNLIHPHIDASLYQIHRLNHDIHVIKVEMGLQKPYSYLDKTYRLDDRNPCVFKLIEEVAPPRPQSPLPYSKGVPSVSSIDAMILPPVYPSHSQSDSREPFFDHSMADTIRIEPADKGYPLQDTPSNLSDLNETTDHTDLFDFSDSTHTQGGPDIHLEKNGYASPTQGDWATPLPSPNTQAISNVTPFLDRLLSIESIDVSITPSSDLGTEGAPSLNLRQQQALDYMGHHYQIQNKKYRSLYSVSHKTAHLELTDMVHKGFIAVRGSGRSTHYILQS